VGIFGRGALGCRFYPRYPGMEGKEGNNNYGIWFLESGTHTGMDRHGETKVGWDLFGMGR
jgi:hypothetical protein